LTEAPSSTPSNEGVEIILDYYTRQLAISMPYGMAVLKHAHSFTIKDASNNAVSEHYQAQYC
jgi:hypothetical protein